MKLLCSMLFITFAVLMFNSCSSSDSPSDEQNSIGGETNIPIAKVGNTFDADIAYGSQNVKVNGSISIKDNTNGIVTVKVIINTASLPSDLKKITDLYPAQYKDGNGNINADLKFKVTSEGILDYMNKDGKPHTIVKYNCNVGDKYELSRSDGKTIMRTVSSKSTTDDFYYPGFGMNIKVIAVERNTSLPGVKKIIYRSNHKFGLIFVQYILEDGSSAGLYLYPKNY